MSRCHRSLVRRTIVSLGLAVAGTLLMTGTASAHVTAQDPEGPAGGYFTTAFKVGHGCEGQPTTKVEIKIPDGVTSVAPQPVEGWTLSTTTRKLDPPVDDHGTQITETTDTVVWDGGSLPADQLQMFWMSMKLPEGAAGTKVFFPVIQTCGSTSNDWIAIPKEGEPEPEFPAASITLVAADGGHGAGSVEPGSGGDDVVSSDDATPMPEPVIDDDGSDSVELATSGGEESDGGSNTLSVVALVFALAALVIALAGFARSSGKVNG